MVPNICLGVRDPPFPQKGKAKEKKTILLLYFTTHNVHVRMIRRHCNSDALSASNLNGFLVLRRDMSLNMRVRPTFPAKRKRKNNILLYFTLHKKCIQNDVKTQQLHALHASYLKVSVLLRDMSEHERYPPFLQK